jgi:hypothetical protein
MVHRRPALDVSVNSAQPHLLRVKSQAQSRIPAASADASVNSAQPHDRQRGGRGPREPRSAWGQPLGGRDEELAQSRYTCVCES